MTRFRSTQILFIELLGGIGDLVIALPAIHALARSHPEARLTVLTFAPGSELLAQDFEVDQVICAAPGAAREAVEQQLATGRFDLVISDTTYEGIAALIETYAQQQSARAVTNLWRSPPDQERVGDRFVQILAAEGLISAAAAQAVLSPDLPQIQLTAAERSAARQQLGALYHPLVVLCPEAGMAIKRWPVQNFIALGRQLQRQGATLVLPSGCEAMAQALDGSVLLSPQSLRQISAILAAADLVVAGDTGLAHIAAALAVPTVTLFGPSWAGRYGHAAPHLNLQGFPACPDRVIRNFTEQRCWYSGSCPLAAQMGWQTCLEAISVEAVLEAAMSRLAPTELASTELSPISPQDMLRTQDMVRSVSDSNHSSVRQPVPASLSLPNPADSWAADLSPWTSVRNLLVMRLDNIGDVIMTSPALRALKANLPQAQLTLLASPAGATTAPLLPWIDRVLSWRTVWQDLGRLPLEPEREWELIRLLQAQDFDAAMIFTSFSQSPHPAGLVCKLAGIPLRLGESKETDRGTLTHAGPAAPDEIHQVERNLRLIEAVGYRVADRQLSIYIPPDLRAAVPQPYLLLNPWTSCPSRNYDCLRFAEAARQLSDQTGWPVVITGMAKDRTELPLLLNLLGDRAIDRVGATSLPELAALIAQARLVLTNNTSVMHLADATQTPLVVTFAGTERPGQWQPRHTPIRLLYRSTVCSPCYRFTCPYELQCLDISVDAVVAAGLELLQSTFHSTRRFMDVEPLARKPSETEPCESR